MEAKKYNYAVTVTEDLLEIRHYPSGINCGKWKNVIKNGDIIKNNSTVSSYVKYSNMRAVRDIRSIIKGNFHNTKYLKHIVFTFDPSTSKKFNQWDLKECNKKKVIFENRFRKYFPEARYIIVPERHEDGRIHYHMVSDVGFVQLDVLKKMWFYGRSSIGCNEEPQDYIVKELSKYVTKNTTKFNARRYYCSNNITKPRKYTGDEALRILSSALKIGLKEYGKEVLFYNEFVGAGSYQPFLLKRKIRSTDIGVQETLCEQEIELCLLQLNNRKFNNQAYQVL